MRVLRRLWFSFCGGFRAILTSVFLLCESGETIGIWDINFWKGLKYGGEVVCNYSFITESRMLIEKIWTWTLRNVE